MGRNTYPERITCPECRTPLERHCPSRPECNWFTCDRCHLRRVLKPKPGLLNRWMVARSIPWVW